MATRFADLSGIVDGPTSYIDAADVTVPLTDLDTALDNSLIGDQEFDQINFTDATELTISSGAITITQTAHTVDTESDAASDNLDTINGALGTGHDMLILMAENAARTVVVKHGTGNIKMTNGADYVLDDTGNSLLLFYDGSQWIGMAGAVPSLNVVEGRLTLTSGTPVLTSNVTAAETLYFTPYRGNRIALYDGTVWGIYTFSELSLDVTALTAAKLYDIFIYNNAGVLTLEASAAWTNATTRADALTTQDGVLVKSGATTRRYLGTIMTYDDSGTTKTAMTFTNTPGSAAAALWVWNYYNRRAQRVGITESTDSWSNTTNAWRAWNNSANNRIDFVIGISEDIVELLLSGSCDDSGGGTDGAVGIGLDSTTAISGTTGWMPTNAAAGAQFATARYHDYPGIGNHYLSCLEYNTSTTALTFYGDAGVPAYYVMGATGTIWG